MKTILLLTNSPEMQRLIPEIFGRDASLVPLTPPSQAGREQFDALFATWSGLADLVMLDAAALGESARWAIESLALAPWQNHVAIMVRATTMQRSLYTMPTEWLVVTDKDSIEQTREAVQRFTALHDTQLQLREVTARRERLPQDPASARVLRSGVGTAAAAESHRYREALKQILRSFGRRQDYQTLLAEFARLLGELLGVGRMALFARPLRSELLDSPSGPTDRLLAVAVSVGVRREIEEHLRLPLDSGIGGFLAREGRILWRNQGGVDDIKIAREFELLGTEVAVPMFDNDALLGVLTFSGKITGELISNDELELVYHLLSHLAQALRTLHLESQVMRQQQFTCEVIAHVTTGVVIVGADSQVVSANQRARELLDLADRELAGKPLRNLPGRVADVLYEVLRTGKELRQHEVTLPRSNRPLGLNVSKISSALGDVVVAFIDDLSQHKAAQSQKQELADREFFTRVAYRLSHELKNSLVSIKIFGQLLPERYGDKDFREQFSGVVVNEVNRVDVLVNNLTFFAQPLGLVYEEVNLTDLIETCAQNQIQEFTRKKLAHLLNMGDKPPEDPGEVPVVTVKRNFAHKTPVLEADRIRLMQALEHVVRNAVQAMPKGGRVLLSTAEAAAGDFPGGKLPEGGAVRIEVQDSGEGISLDMLRRVTEPFVTTRNVGVGLGLTIVKKIVERHSGRLLIDSMLGRGSTVTLVIPVVMQPHPEDKLLAQLAKSGGPEFFGGETSDEDQNRLAELLETHRRRRSQKSEA